MSVESLMQTCADLRTKLRLKGDNSALLKAKQKASETQTEALSTDADETVTSTPEATRSMPTKKQTNQPHEFDSSELEVNKLLDGHNYDARMIDAKDPVTRQSVSAQLLVAAETDDSAQQERAKEAFLKHGFFNEVTSDLRKADSPAERAAAARKLGLIGNREATSHLIAGADHGP